MQRFFDILFSGFALLVLSPLLVPVMIVLKLTGEGYIFYVHSRVGRYGRIFKLLKFATMLKNSPNLGTGDITVKNDTRVLPFGRVLRKTKINELPQLINIFLGDMSIVGPRPLTPKNFSSYFEGVQAAIATQRPGLTGIGSIVFRDEERLLEHADNKIVFYNSVISPYKGQLELWYIKNKSLVNYFLIIFATAWVVLFPKSQIIWRLFKDLPKPPENLNMK
ncbi:MAG TPA: lipid carrier--UDP-N-acetylgalactosaminyltransferase [Deltaproteobacteria bacterium]|nr:lipid carrier--UDP-N-acetylgalactosaminyltransferase [Deltaproteobacteria bacterium]